jgi:predicted HTH domain antitoxin
MAVAVRLYSTGKLSLGQAADVVGLSKRSFMELMGDYGVTLFNYSAEDLDRDVDSARL